MTPPLTPAQRKAAERVRMRAAGFVLLQVWVHKRDRAYLERVVKRLRGTRAPS